MAEPRGAARPPGWPAGVLPSDAPGWEATATAWLLDQCPPDYRDYEVLRRHPVVLCRFAAHHVVGALGAARAAYAGARRELGPLVEPDVLQSAMRALEAEGARLGRVQREIELVEQALMGRRWRPRL
ncbi:MAG: hypothetical protein ACHQ06_07690 [Candidatus Dormibacteria bacterium]